MFVEAKEDLGTKATEVFTHARRYAERNPAVADEMTAVTHVIAETERAVERLAERLADSPEGVRQRTERVERALQVLHTIGPADPSAELVRLQDHQLSLVKKPDVGWVKRQEDEDLRRNGSTRQNGIWTWYLGLSADAQREQYFAAIDSNDEETVTAIEMLPSSMSPLTDATKQTARERKLRRLPNELKEGLATAEAGSPRSRGSGSRHGAR
jgi:hypothetical protein